MHAHVTTYRLSTSDEVAAEMSTEDVLSDQGARTIASYWHSPSAYARNITALSHGLPFDTDELRDEISREITDTEDAAALTEWLDMLEAILSE